METTTKKATIATVKSFIRKNREKMFIKVRSRFDSMTDGVEFNTKAGFKIATPDGAACRMENTQGISGVWLVGYSRDRVTPYKDENFEGFQVSNSCGSFIIAVLH